MKKFITILIATLVATLMTPATVNGEYEEMLYPKTEVASTETVSETEIQPEQRFEIPETTTVVPTTEIKHQDTYEKQTIKEIPLTTKIDKKAEKTVEETIETTIKEEATTEKNTDKNSELVEETTSSEEYKCDDCGRIMDNPCFTAHFVNNKIVYVAVQTDEYYNTCIHEFDEKPNELSNKGYIVYYSNRNDEKGIYLIRQTDNPNDENVIIVDSVFDIS